MFSTGYSSSLTDVEIFNLEMSRDSCFFPTAPEGQGRRQSPMKSGCRYRRNRLKWCAKQWALTRNRGARWPASPLRYCGLHKSKRQSVRNSAAQLQRAARERADDQARRIPWQRLYDARNQYIDWQEFTLWARSILEVEKADSGLAGRDSQ